MVHTMNPDPINGFGHLSARLADHSAADDGGVPDVFRLPLVGARIELVLRLVQMEKTHPADLGVRLGRPPLWLSTYPCCVFLRINVFFGWVV